MEYSKGKMKIDFTKRIEEYKEKSDKEILAYLSDFSQTISYIFFWIKHIETKIKTTIISNTVTIIQQVS